MSISRTVNLNRGAKKFFATSLAAVMVLSSTPFSAMEPQVARAETNDIYAEADEAQQKIEASATAYDEASSRVAELDTQISENESRIDQLVEVIPAQQDKAAAAYRQLYKMQQSAPGLIELVVSSDTFSDFMTNLDYVTYIQESSEAQIDSLKSMKSELTVTRTNLSTAKKEAEVQQTQAQESLAEAQELRQEVQRKAQEKAAAEQAAIEAEKTRAAQDAAKQVATSVEAAVASEADAAITAVNASESAEAVDETVEVIAAEEEAKAKAEAEAKAKAEEEAKAKAEAEAAAKAAEEAEAAANAEAEATTNNDNVDWSSDKTSFVDEWAGRIDNYLAGSPLEGTGRVFAEAAWDYGVDPRWSPAISCIESTKGTYCFASHNAWGWGSVSWDSWDEAIRDHVAGLARGYGYTISTEAAQRYCPPNWQSWYDNVSYQMSLI